LPAILVFGMQIVILGFLALIVYVRAKYFMQTNQKKIESPSSDRAQIVTLQCYKKVRKN
jgi:hypothetical protein